MGEGKGVVRYKNTLNQIYTNYSYPMMLKYGDPHDYDLSSKPKYVTEIYVDWKVNTMHVKSWHRWHCKLHNNYLRFFIIMN